MFKDGQAGAIHQKESERNKDLKLDARNGKKKKKKTTEKETQKKQGLALVFFCFFRASFTNGLSQENVSPNHGEWQEIH